MTAILDSRSGISHHVGKYGRKIAGRRSRHSDRGTNGRRPICQTVDGKLVLVKQKSCPVRTALHTKWGPVVTDPVSYAVLRGKEDVVILTSPTLVALGINVYDSLDECVSKRNLSVQCVESSNFKECRRVSITV